MQNISIQVTTEDLDNYEHYMDLVQDYPLYGHCDGLSRCEIVLLGKILEYEFGNKDTITLNMTVYDGKESK